VKLAARGGAGAVEALTGDGLLHQPVAALTAERVAVLARIGAASADRAFGRAGRAVRRRRAGAARTTCCCDTAGACDAAAGATARAAAAALSAAACTSTAGGPGARVATTGATDHRMRPPAGDDGRRCEEGDEQEQATPIADR